MAACVEHTANSTFISRVMQAGAFNYASMDGNAALTSGVVKYNTLSAAHCATSGVTSATTYHNLLGSLLTSNQSLAVLSQSTAIRSLVSVLIVLCGRLTSTSCRQ